MNASSDRLTHADIGAWIVQGNPVRSWDYFRARHADGLGPGDWYDNGWTLHTSYRVELMKPGDPIVLWLTDVRNSRLWADIGVDYWPGVYEIGIVSGFAQESYGYNDEYVVDPNYEPRSGHSIDFAALILTKPLRTIDLRNDPALALCEKFRVPMMGNPLHLTPAETVALAAHIPKGALKKSGWDAKLKQQKYKRAGA